MNELLELTKSDLKDLLGIKEGIRLYHRLKTVKKERSNYSSSSSSDPSSSPTSLSGLNIHDEMKPPGYYGYCSELDCHLPAPHTCSSPDCDRTLCIKHMQKSILTGAAYCQECADKITFASEIKQGMGWDKVDTEQCVIS